MFNYSAEYYGYLYIHNYTLYPKNAVKNKMVYKILSIHENFYISKQQREYDIPKMY